MKDRKNVVPISHDCKLCKDCIHNESAADKEYSAKLICGRHGKIVDICDEACEDYEILKTSRKSWWNSYCIAIGI